MIHSAKSIIRDGTDAIDVYHQQISVGFDYPVLFTNDVFNEKNPLLIDVMNRRNEHRLPDIDKQGSRHRLVVYIDAGLAEAQPQLAGKIEQYFQRWSDRAELLASPFLIPPGRKSKASWKVLYEIIETLAHLRIDRHGFVVIIGGGSVLDIVGFAASIVHRGLRVIRMPSTTLSQDDAGVGVKNGMDVFSQKNFVGTFAPPFAVINDFDLLETLPQEHWIGGVAEAFKVAIIKDADFFRFLCDNADALRNRSCAIMEQVIRRCAVLHLEHIRTSGDPFEFGSARPLDFGHWSAHRIEVLSDYTIPHGQAVAIGIALDSIYAAKKGLLSEAELEDILMGISATGLPTYSEYLLQRDHEGKLEIFKGLDHFREHLGGELTITLPMGLGNRCEVHEIDTDLVIQSIYQLKRWSESANAIYHESKR